MMVEAEESVFGRVARWKIKIAAGSRCELCNGRFPTSGLRIHLIYPGWKPGMAGDPQGAILVLCPTCHGSVHSCSLPLPDQRDLLRHRQKAAKRAIRRILRYIPKPYTVPESDLAEIYAQAAYDYRWAG